MSENER